MNKIEEKLIEIRRIVKALDERLKWLEEEVRSNDKNNKDV